VSLNFARTGLSGKGLQAFTKALEQVICYFIELTIISTKHLLPH
jgi:hypothetical protein